MSVGPNLRNIGHLLSVRPRVDVTGDFVEWFDQSENTTGYGGKWSIPVPFETVLRWYWGVQEFTFNGLLIEGATNYHYTNKVFTRGHLILSGGSETADKEIHTLTSGNSLVGGGSSANAFIFRDSQSSDLGSGFPSGIGFSLLESMNPTGFFNPSDPGVVYPAIRIITNGPNAASWQSFWGTSGRPPQSGTIYIDGIEVPVYGTGTVSGTFTPTKFFEYRNSRGEQVFDANTGAILNDPFA